MTRTGLRGAEAMQDAGHQARDESVARADGAVVAVVQQVRRDPREPGRAPARRSERVEAHDVGGPMPVSVISSAEVNRTRPREGEEALG